jgi:hypothetical protein
MEEHSYPDEDQSWAAEWKHLAEAIGSGEPVLGSLQDAHYAWSRVEDAYTDSPEYARLAAALKP